MIGGVLIAAYRTETGEFVAYEIPATDFQGGCFTHRRYLSTSWVCAQRSLDTLKHTAGEPIEVCSGFIHDETHRKLDCKIVKIGGPFQERIESALLDYLHKIGFPYQGSTEAYGKLFFQSVMWLKGGNPNRRSMDAERVRMAKTGWRTFHFYRDLPYLEAVAAAKQFKSRRRFSRWRDHGGDDC